MQPRSSSESSSEGVRWKMLSSDADVWLSESRSGGWCGYKQVVRNRCNHDLLRNPQARGFDGRRCRATLMCGCRSGDDDAQDEIFAAAVSS